MKRLSLVLTAIGASALVIQTAHASLLFSEAFNYTTPGNLGGNVNPGSGYTWGPGNSAMTIASGNLTYSGLQDLGGNELSVVWGGGSAGSITNGFATVTSGSIYYSFLLDVTTAPSANSYLTSLNPGTSTPNGGSDALSVYTYSATSGFRLGLRTGGATAVTTPSGSPFSLNTTYFIVVQYDFGASLATLYLNPTPGGSQPANTLQLTPTTAPTSIDNVGFKVQSSPTGAFLIDNLLIGTTWGDVTPAVPEPATFALAGVGMLGLFLARRMRR